MRRFLALACFALVAYSVRANDRPFLQRLAERTPPPLPQNHTMARAGYPQQVKEHVLPSMTRFDHAGYVGGGSLCNNNLRTSGPASAIGPLQDGTFATDFGGFRAHLGRVFLASSTDPSRGHPTYFGYRAEGPRVTDVFALRPLRKAVLEKHAADEEKKHGKGGEEKSDGH